MQISSVHRHKDKKSTRLSRKTESLVLLCFYKKQCRMQKLREACETQLLSEKREKITYVRRNRFELGKGG